MKGPLKIFVFLVLPVTIALVWMSGLFSAKVEPGTQALPVKEVKGVEVREVEPVNYQVGLSVPGTVIAHEEAHVSSELMATVTDILVQKGSLVKEGDPLIQLDPDQVAAQARQAQTVIEGAQAALQSMDHSIRLSMAAVDQAQVQVQQAEVELKNQETTFQRIKSLYEKGAVGKQEYDNAETQYLSSQNRLREAKSALAEAQASLDLMKSRKGEVRAQVSQAEAGYQTASVNLQDATIRAPFSGIVVDTLADIGDMAAPGQALVVMEKTPYYLEIFVDERKVSKLAIGDEMDVTIDALEQEFTGEIAELTPRIDENSRKFRIKMILPEEAKVTSGMFGYATIPESSEEGIFIPESAIKRWSQFTGVFVVDENSVTHLRYVQLGKKQNGLVEVLSGLDHGERIVLSPSEEVADQVKVVPSS